MPQPAKSFSHHAQFTAQPVTPDAECAAGGQTTGSAQAQAALLKLDLIRTDGDTQQRSIIDAEIVKSYAELMGSGIQFPPVTVWYDGTSYWLSDGFHRAAAARLLNRNSISAVVHRGSVNDARWDSYHANSSHGVRRTNSDLKAIVLRAINHPNARQLSNLEIAKHLNIAEATLRRWRKRLSPSFDKDRVRIVTRGTAKYAIDTTRIGKTRKPKRAKLLRDLGTDLLAMKQQGSLDARRFLNVMTKWIHGPADAGRCLRAIEQIIADLKMTSASTANV
jgi:hypothetical protein